MTPRELIENYVADVAMHLEGKNRADIACELYALISDSLRARAERAGRRADQAMARALLDEFGRPAEVAASYRTGGLTIIPPSQSSAFLKTAIAGVVIQWAIGIAIAVARVKAGVLASRVLQEWFFSSGLGALWWPGFMVLAAAGAAWLKQRKSPKSVDGGSEMNGNHKAAQLGASIGLPFAAFFAVFYIAPGWFVGHIAPTGFDVTGFTYTDEFRSLRLPALIAYMTSNVVLLAVIAMKGIESRMSRRLAIIIGLAGAAIMSWCVFGGPMFMLPPIDKLVRLILLVIVFFALIDLIQRIARELIISRRDRPSAT